jgi:peptidyl-prolyl cis-trans isomerase D
MISTLRRSLDSWPVRIFFGVMVLSFVFWGVGDVVRLSGSDTWVAKVGDTTIEAVAVQSDYQRAMAAATRSLPPGQDAPPELRRRVGEETVQRLVTQAALSGEIRSLRIVVPDASVAELAREMPAFRGPDGKFSRPAFDMILRNNGLTEARFLDMLRGDVAQRQLLSAVSAGGGAPEVLITPIYVAEFQKRSARLAEFPLSAAAEPPPPDDAMLKRWYDNHPDSYKTPEFRRVKAVLLTPQRLAQDIQVTDAELQEAFERTRAQYATEGKRSAEVISVTEEDKAKALAEQWRAGADWAAMQTAASGQGAAAITMDDATPAQFPDADLSKAVFAATPGAVTDPIKGALGWYVVRVSSATAASNPTFDDVKEQVKERVVADKAADLMYDRANKVDGLLANGNGLDDMPDDLGLVGLAGTLDAEGMTQDNEPAPIPGSSELRSLLISTAFQTQKGDPARLIEAQSPSAGTSAYFALVVEDVIPAALKPYEDVAERVLEDWKADQQRRAQEEAAAKMLAAIKGGQSFEDAATVAGVTERTTPVLTRGETPEGIPAEVTHALFTLKPNEPTMVETPEAFVIVTLAEVIDPDAKADADGYRQVRQAVTRSIGADIGATFTEALRLRANPRINQKSLDQIVQP